MVNARIFLGNGRKKKFIQGTVSTTVSYNKCFLYGRPKKQTNCHGHFDRFSLALTLLSPPRIPGFACVLARGLLFSRAEEEEEDIVINLPREKRRERATNDVPFLPFVRRCVVMSRWRRRALPDEPTILYALNFDISIMIADKKGTHITNYPFVFGRAIPVWRYASFALPPPRKEGGLIIIARYLSLSYTHPRNVETHRFTKKYGISEHEKYRNSPRLNSCFHHPRSIDYLFFSLRHQSFSYRQGCLPKRMFFFSTKHTNISLSPQKSKNFFTASKHIRSFLQLRFRTLLLSRLPLSPLRLAQLEQHFFSFSGVWDSVSFFSSHFPLFVAVF